MTASFIVKSNIAINEKKELTILKENVDPLCSNIIGNFMKNRRLKVGMSRQEVAKISRFTNRQKTIKKITEIEDESRVYDEYIKEFAQIYDFSLEEFEEIVEKHKNENMRKKVLRKEFYLEIINNIDMLSQNIEIINSTPEYYFSPIFDSYFHYWNGPNNLYFGEIIAFWSAKKLTSRCPKCGKTVYITHALGSTFSGSGRAFGYCVECQTEVLYYDNWQSLCVTASKLKRRERPCNVQFVQIKEIIHKLQTTPYFNQI